MDKDKIKSIEDKISFNTHKEYIDYHNKIDLDNINEKEIIKKANILFELNSSIEDKKRLLFNLAHFGTLEAYKILEKYCKNPDKELKEFSALALGECRMFLENELLEDEISLVSGGLEGTTNKIRILIVIFSLNEKDFTKNQKEIIKKEYQYICKIKHTDLENVEFEDHYASILILLPHDVALAEIVDEGIKKCNELGEFIFDGYYATNQEIPKKTEILEIIEKVKSGDYE